MSDEIVIRRRFPNYVFDGKPLGDDKELYINRIKFTPDFYDLEWVKEKDEHFGIKGWFLSMFVFEDTTGIYALYEDNTMLCHAILEEGELDMLYFVADDNIHDKVMEYFDE